MSFWQAAASFVGDIIGGIAGNEAADDVADAQRYASRQNIELAKLLYDDQRALNMPRIAAGNAALEQAMALTGLSFPRGAEVTAPSLLAQQRHHAARNGADVLPADDRILGLRERAAPGAHGRLPGHAPLVSDDVGDQDDQEQSESNENALHDRLSR